MSDNKPREIGKVANAEFRPVFSDEFDRISQHANLEHPGRFLWVEEGRFYEARAEYRTLASDQPFTMMMRTRAVHGSANSERAYYAPHWISDKGMVLQAREIEAPEFEAGRAAYAVGSPAPASIRGTPWLEGWNLAAMEAHGARPDRQHARWMAENRHWWSATIAPTTETVALANGKAAQALIPGVAPVSLHTRELEAHQAKRMAKRRNEPMQAGGLFDDVARAQQSLF